MATEILGFRLVDSFILMVAFFNFKCAINKLQFVYIFVRLCGDFGK